MASNEQNRDPRIISRNDPRRPKAPAENRKVDEARKRVASRSPVGSMQPLQKNPKQVNGLDPRRRPSADATPPSSRRGSIQSNANLASAGNGAPSTMMAPRTQTAPVAIMGGGNSPPGGQLPHQDSVISDLPAQPSYTELLMARADITGKLTFARTEREKASPERRKAKLAHDTISQYFTDYPALKDYHTNQVKIAQRKYDKANNLSNLMEQELAQVNELLKKAPIDPPSGTRVQSSPTSNELSEVKSSLAKMQEHLSHLASELAEVKVDVQQRAMADRTVDVESREIALAALKTESTRQGQTLSEIQGEIQALKTSTAEQNGLVDRGMKRQNEQLDQLNDRVEQSKNSMAGLVDRVTKLEENKDENPLGLVQFKPVAGPEQPSGQPDLNPTQEMWAIIESLRMATDNHKKQLDNLTTDDVVAQMVNVMSQQYPDAKNCQAAFEGLRGSIAQLNDRITQVSAQAGQTQDDAAKAEVSKLRTDLEALKLIVDGHATFAETSGQGTNELVERMDGLGREMGILQGQQRELERQIT